MSLSVDELDLVARRLASRAHPDDRDDIRQEIWEKYLRYPPQTFRGAWMIGRHAVVSFYRRRQREQRTFTRMPEGADGELDDGDRWTSDWLPSEFSYDDSHIFTWLALGELRTAAPREFTRFVRLWCSGGKVLPMLARVHLHRLRKRIIRRATPT